MCMSKRWKQRNYRGPQRLLRSGDLSLRTVISEQVGDLLMGSANLTLTQLVEMLAFHHLH